MKAHTEHPISLLLEIERVSDCEIKELKQHLNTPIAQSLNRLLSIMAIALIAIACQWGQSAAPATNEQPVPQEQPASQRTQLQLMAWVRSAAEDKQLQATVDSFNQANPDLAVTLNLTPDFAAKLQSALASAAPPDLFSINSFDLPALAQAGALAPAHDRLTHPDDFYPVLRNAFTLDGVFYCPPAAFSTLALVYNQALFDAAGIAYPTAAWTWDDLRTAAAALTNAESRIAGLALNPDSARWLTFVYQAGGRVTDASFTRMTINSPEAQQAFEFAAQLVKEGIAMQASDLDSRWPGEALGKGKAAMTIEGNWIVPFLHDQFPAVKVGIAELPSGPAGKATIAFPICYSVAANGQQIDASFKLLDYLVAPESMKAASDLGLTMPTRQSLREGWLQQFPDRAAFLQGVDYAYPWQFRPGFQEVLDALNTGLQQVYLGVRLSADVLAEAEIIGNVVLGAE
jgi:multiple sugar transport system substrate-binding protein